VKHVVSPPDITGQERWSTTAAKKLLGDTGAAWVELGLSVGELIAGLKLPTGNWNLPLGGARNLSFTIPIPRAAMGAGELALSGIPVTINIPASIQVSKGVIQAIIAGNGTIQTAATAGRIIILNMSVAGGPGNGSNGNGNSGNGNSGDGSSGNIANNAGRQVQRTARELEEQLGAIRSLQQQVRQIQQEANGLEELFELEAELMELERRAALIQSRLRNLTTPRN